MTAQLMQRCDVHTDPADCPDVLVSYHEKFDSYGQWIHDGGASVLSISHCPWFANAGGRGLCSARTGIDCAVGDWDWHGCLLLVGQS
jgi:hypothetical protein